MRIRIEIDALRRTVSLDEWRSDTTVADLVAAVGGVALEPDERLFVDATEVAAGSALGDAPVLEGSRLSRTATPAVHQYRDWTVTVSGGLGSGEVVPVPEGREMVIGRSPYADVVLRSESASWEHLSIVRADGGLVVMDGGSTNGTFLGGQRIEEQVVAAGTTVTLTAGGVTMLLRPEIIEPRAPEPGSLHNVGPARTVPFNRPPRPGLPPATASVEPPAKKLVASTARFSFAAVLAPIVMAAAMVMLLGSWRFAMFALLSPVMAIGVWIEQKHRYAKDLKKEELRFSEALEAFDRKLLEAAQAETRRRHELAPDPATVVRRAHAPSTRLWQRRHDSEDFLWLHAGVGDVPWKPPLDTRIGAQLEGEVIERLERHRLHDAPVIADLNRAGVVGIVGDREGALALARSLMVQAAVHCGPADLTMAVFTDRGHKQDWGWAAWLPHTRNAGSSEGLRWMSSGREASETVLRGMRQDVNSFLTPHLMLVLDAEWLTEGRDAPARELLGHGRHQEDLRTGPHQARQTEVSGIVLASAEEQLPASCTAVIHVDADALARLVEPGARVTVEELTVAGLTLEDAEACARRLAMFEDPELTVPGAALPSMVRMPELLGMESPTVEDVLQSWDASQGVCAPVGVSEDGTFMLDLVQDGPHGLVGGTTGSGKSEFLRTFVAGLAVRNNPTQLNFILIDFKGGAAFAACERFPHTIGTISNLDEQLADRALQSLEAEMQRRQLLFAAAGEGVDNLDDYLATELAEPMPRLLLVIDEFAMLAKEFPDVLSSLVSVAAVGRTLGVHMLLATQRPAGVVNDDILANTNLRVALRVQSREDSSNVIGVPDAAAIGRAQRGRAYVKLGQHDISAVQTALVTGRAEVNARDAVEFREIDGFGRTVENRAKERSVLSEADDLDLLIEAVREAAQRRGMASPRQVWPEALGEAVALRGFSVPHDGGADHEGPTVGGLQGTLVEVGLVDEPERQRQVAGGWDLAHGNLLLVGVPGSGTTTTLASLALTTALHRGPEDLEIMVLDMGSGGLEALRELPHTVAYVGTGAGGKERQARFLRTLYAELTRRRSNPGSHPARLILVDGFASLREEFSDPDGQPLLDLFYRVYADGPAQGMHFAVSTTRSRALPMPMDEVTLQKWVFRLADHYDYGALGIKGKDLPAALPGRCVIQSQLRQMHVATPVGGVRAAVVRVRQQWPTAQPKKDVIGQLPSRVSMQYLGVAPDLNGEPWIIPVGLREQDLEPVVLEIFPGENVLIAGPARSGKSTLLIALGKALGALDGDRPEVWGVCSRRSPLAAEDFHRIVTEPEEIPPLAAQLRLVQRPVVLLVDDAERFEDTDQSLAQLVASEIPGVCVVAAGRADDLRSKYSHWTTTVRKSRCGVLLQPNVDFDGDLLGVRLPRKAPVAMSTGRGYVVTNGGAELAQTIAYGVQ